ncbi:MAG TPA: family 78 glycoside hydrolase catalytic domain, partial [Chitinophaga sp.]|nr:family 78 glycoside hydrolase catalytic domain [Chitinophaga sp.]
MKYLIISFLACIQTLYGANIQVSGLRCEMLTNPEGIDVVTPRLSWEIAGDARNIAQQSYQVLVASSREKLDAGEGDLWNSGKITSGRSVHIAYAGKALTSRQQCYWKIKVWTTKGESKWSAPAYWSMGLLMAADWRAKWIGTDTFFTWDDAANKFSRLSARYYRKTFDVRKKVRRAMVYVSGPGLYELYINGHRIGSQVMAQSPTDYRKTVKYNSYDVTDALQQGRNAIAAITGNGFYFTMRQAYKPHKIRTFGYPRLLLQLDVELEGGARILVVTDDSWKLNANGPIRSNNIYDGEEYDASKEMPGWSTAAYDDRFWSNADVVPAPGGKLRAQMNEFIRIVDSIKPLSVKAIHTDTFLVDMGQNMAGWLQLKMKDADRGHRVSLRFGETLQPNGRRLFTENLRDAKATDIYLTKGGGKETWSPSFVYHGFRYAEIAGYPGRPSPDDILGQVVSDDLPLSGSFETSDPTINSIYKNAWWGIRSNYKGIPVDCPQRNERMPWLGDRTTGAYGESFLFDNAKLYAKWLDDMEDAQTAEGAIPDVVPAYWNYASDNMTWPGAYLTIAEMLYHQFGDVQPVIRHYASMKRWIDYMGSKYLVDNIMTKDKYGDWCVPPESKQLIHSKDSTRKTDGTLLATAYYYHLLNVMKRFAVISGNAQDTAAFLSRAAAVKDAFNRKFFHPETAGYSNNTVTANLLPLYFGMVPADKKQQVFDSITACIMNKYGGHISTGVVGTQWLMRGLSRNGKPDLAYLIAADRDYPGWGYMVENGATTIWELWNGNTANPEMNSQNHVMLLGDLLIW